MQQRMALYLSASKYQNEKDFKKLDLAVNFIGKMLHL